MAGSVVMAGPGRVQVGAWFSRGWDWFVEDLGWHILIALIASLFMSLVFVVIGPVAAGLVSAGLRKARGNRVEVGDFFNGFRFFLPSFLASLLIVVFSGIGLIFLIVPGLVILAMYQFTFHFIVDREQDFWQAMESSRQLVAKDYFGFTVFLTVNAFLNFLGVIFFGIGILVTLPVTWLAMTAAYLDCTGGVKEQQLPLFPAAPPVKID